MRSVLKGPFSVEVVPLKRLPNELVQQSAKPKANSFRVVPTVYMTSREKNLIFRARNGNSYGVPEQNETHFFWVSLN